MARRGGGGGGQGLTTDLGSCPWSGCIFGAGGRAPRAACCSPRPAAATAAPPAHPPTGHQHTQTREGAASKAAPRHHPIDAHGRGPYLGPSQGQWLRVGEPLECREGRHTGQRVRQQRRGQARVQAGRSSHLVCQPPHHTQAGRPAVRYSERGHGAVRHLAQSVRSPMRGQHADCMEALPPPSLFPSLPPPLPNYLHGVMLGSCKSWPAASHTTARQAGRQSQGSPG